MSNTNEILAYYTANNSFQRTTISVKRHFFCEAKKPPLMVAAEAGVIAFC